MSYAHLKPIAGFLSRGARRVSLAALVGLPASAGHGVLVGRVTTIRGEDLGHAASRKQTAGLLGGALVFMAEHETALWEKRGRLSVQAPLLTDPTVLEASVVPLAPCGASALGERGDPVL